jgi:uncharacterized protein
VEKPRSELFKFFENPYNLEKITPPFLNFRILGKTETKVFSGQLIDYKLKIHGVPASWRTLIKEYQAPDYFIDVQLKGPYEAWHHTHRFIALGDKRTLLVDEVLYALPFGFLGEIFLRPFILKDINQIFSYRKKVIGETFEK